MQNVIPFQSGAARSRVKLSQLRADHFIRSDIADSELLERVNQLREEARDEIQLALAYLDIALTNARLAARQIADPSVRAGIERQVISITETFELACSKARDI